MTSVITGDIINSRNSHSQLWLKNLKSVLNEIGSTPKVWEIFRGDSFQVEVSDPKNALREAIKIKAAIKTIKDLDVRMSIGIGEKEYVGDSITESNGSAFVHSGEGFELLKKNKQTLGVFSNNEAFNDDINLLLRLSLIAMDNWTPAVAEYVSIDLREGLLQEQIAKFLDIGQSSVSERNKRSYLTEIKEVENWYKSRVKTI